jgi:hypothetical protein
MKSKKLILEIAMLLTIAFTACGQQYDSPSDFRVSPLNGGRSAEITEYVGNKQTVNIPPRIAGMTITKIGDSAFSGKELIRVTIPNTITVIGENAFASNRFTSITLPIGLTSIGHEAFMYCTNLTGSLMIPASVMEIGFGAFDGCNLTNITVDTENPNYSSEDGILYNKARTTLIKVPEGRSDTVTIPTSVTSIGDGYNAFAMCTNLASITIPTSVTSISAYVFYGWTSSQTIYIKGHASQAAADAAWGMDRYGGWRSNCYANIVYGQ